MRAQPSIAAARREHRRRLALRIAQERLTANLAEELKLGLSPKQLAFFLDTSDLVVAITARQAGKTEGCVRRLLACLTSKPDAAAYYIAPTRSIAKDTIWARLKAECARRGIDENTARINETELSITLPSGAFVRLIGAPDKKRADRIRGQTLDLIVIDEAASFDDELLAYLVEDCAAAALGIRKGQIVVISTPGMMPSGFLYDLHQKTGIEASRHSWDTSDNPAYGDNPAAYLAKVRKKFGYDETTPKYVREWLGLWVTDLSSQVYQIHGHNLIDDPGSFDCTVMGVDFGWSDQSTICVLGWSAGSKTLTVQHSFGESEMTITDFAEQIRMARDKYKPLVIVADGAARQSLEEIQQHHGVYMEPVNKAPGYKVPLIMQVNADLKRDLIKVPRDAPLVAQARVLQWAKNKRGVKEDQRQPNDHLDAFIYAYSKATAYLETASEPEPEHGTDEYWRKDAEKRKQELIDGAEDERPAYERSRDDEDPWEPMR